MPHEIHQFAQTQLEAVVKVQCSGGPIASAEAESDVLVDDTLGEQGECLAFPVGKTKRAISAPERPHAEYST